jgi:hypothetical protein
VNRDELIEAGAQAIYGEPEQGPSLVAEQMREGCRTLAEDVIDVVEPLIRADERERVSAIADLSFLDALTTREELENLRADLRAKVEALHAENEAYKQTRPTEEWALWAAISDAYRRALALIDGSSDA